MIWSIASQTGWSVRYILDRVNYPTLIMMSADAPRYVSGKRREKPVKIQSKEQSDGFFKKLSASVKK